LASTVLVIPWELATMISTTVGGVSFGLTASGFPLQAGTVKANRAMMQTGANFTRELL